MKRSLLASLLALSLGVGCSHVLYRPEADSVKTVAVVSLYMNREIYDVEHPTAADAKTLGGLIKAAATTAVRDRFGDPEAKAVQPIVTYGVKAFSEQLSSVGRWQFIPPTDVVAHAGYKAFYEGGVKGNLGKLLGLMNEAAMAEYVAPEGMIVIPVSRVVDQGSVGFYGDARDPKEEMRQQLAKLAQDLGVDAVAVVQLDVAYKRGWFIVNGMRRAAGNVAAAAVIITKEGKIALQTDFGGRGGGKRFEGDTLRMVSDEDGKVGFENPEVVESFNSAVSQAAKHLQQQVIEEFAKAP